METPLSRRVLAEVIGTFGFFFLGFIGIAAATTEPGSIGSIGLAAGFGLGLGLMIFALGHISGGHYNPSVTLGLACGGRFAWKDLPAYWGGQLAGGLCAAGLVRVLFTAAVGKALVNAPAANVSDAKALVLEAVATLLFLLVISSVATDERAPWYGVFAPVAIGGFIFTAATVVGPFTSGSFNPARSLAPALIAGDFSKLWIFIVGPLVGGALGGLVYAFMRKSGTTSTAKDEHSS